MLNYLNIEKRHGRAQNTLTEADLKGAIGRVLPGISGDWNVAAIYFVRHGQTDYNAARRVQGIVDVPINGHGHSQAQRNGRVLNELIQATIPARFRYRARCCERARPWKSCAKRWALPRTLIAPMTACKKSTSAIGPA